MAFETLIDVDSLRTLLAAGTAGAASGAGVTVIDCRFDLMNPGAGRQAYQAGHIPGAVYADLNRDLSARPTSASGRHPLPDPDAFASWLRTRGVGNSTQVVAYDDANGSYAARLWWMLRWLGHTQVAVLDGGIKAWVAEGGALQAGPVAAAPAQPRPAQQQPTQSQPGSGFSPRVDATAVISSAELADRLRTPRGLRAPHSLLVDARSALRYAGKVEPLDSVAGHVPGAVNHPFTENLAPDGRFLPAAELRRRWDARLAGTPPAAVMAMCGSGVTACHNLLSLEVAGLRGAKLYAGSWSEWIRDPKRPIARGDAP